ncbi:MAG TPA: N-(5'-phosphoribosyl)anthranilate isomerase, partial [Archaeoglobaceae archaeon]|nr:N-(5'-phosphoribosyl)anthranilate isomerase [Archaeoglobaceae archaeon]
KVHDLRVSREIFRKVDNAILAGGLNPVNVRGIIEFVKPFGVDVSSGVEKNGVKDPELIRSFVEVVKSMNCLK